MNTDSTSFDPHKAKGPIQDPQTYALIGAAQKVHRVLGPGFKEATYEQALRVELSEQSIPFIPQPEYTVCYNNHPCGTYVPDLVAYNQVVLELKAISGLSEDHTSQILSYLRVTNLPVGLLFNFGRSSLEFRRYYHPSQKQIPKSFNP